MIFGHSIRDFLLLWCGVMTVLFSCGDDANVWRNHFAVTVVRFSCDMFPISSQDHLKYYEVTRTSFEHIVVPECKFMLGSY
ncbi:hypothetical protein ONE63_004525 [Megalurothrips usitatus]|uniref:Secreted protein n=1 Tax=Megalurothrips usitatus TaxID=439358 RepID=A0AAV7X9L2_9NEOP|nr:hypothetical protein ONE63_004525 [Megalurothrips usitatus]